MDNIDTAAGPSNIPEFTVTELSVALKSGDRDGLSAGARARRDQPALVPPLGPLLFPPEGRERRPRRRVLEGHHAAPRPQDRGGHGGHRHRQAHDLCRLVALPDHRRSRRARRRRRAAEAPGGSAQAAAGRGPVRRRAQATAALPARRDRRGDLADRRGDPRHPARLSDRFPRHVLVWPVAVQGEKAAAEVAAAIAGFNRLPEQAAGAAARSPDRGARRRQPRGSLGLQRGDRGARRGGVDHPADLGGGPRDRHDPDRFRHRPPCAHADAPRPRWRCRCAPT